VQADREARLIKRAQQGEESAVSQLYRDNVQAIYRYVYYRVGNQNVAEDLTAETFLRAIEGLDRYVYRGVPFRAWLYRIASARVVDHLRAQARENVQPLDAIRHGHDPGLESSVSTQLEIEKLTALLPRLTDEQQQVLILRFLSGHSVEETAALMDKTSGAIKSLQHRALRSLARLFEQEHGARG
jgi:RNA polymerase sigma-70 factor (ECF subfamily)